MQAMMMNRPLRIIDILSHAAEVHPDQGLISVRTEGDIHRETYGQALDRAARMAQALLELGITQGDRVATLAWNGYRHFELYYAISGIGAVCHTINPRLSAEQMTYIINHAQDRLLFVDTTFLPIVEALRDQLPPELRVVVMTDPDRMPDSPLGPICYEDLIRSHAPGFDWPEFDENTASGLCYTSGTTGNPKGALYSHRSTVLHAMLVPLSQTTTFQAGRKVLPVVPQFHVNAWGLPYSAPLMGLTLVMPGGRLDGPSLFDLMDQEQVYSAWGVPTVWQGLLSEIESRGRAPSGFQDLLVGGSAAPQSMIAAYEAHGVSVSQAWGMTEMSPIGTHGALPPDITDADTKLALKSTAGQRVFGVDFKIVDDDGTRLPHDGAAKGVLFVRGNTIASGYFNDEQATRDAMDDEGWFGTGDVASVTPNGRLTIHDRAKDLVKSGGEWISSIDLENAAMSHPGIATCAAVAMPHPDWGERPILVAVATGDDHPDLSEIRAHMAPHFASWQLPDDLIWVDQLPLTATGKVSKLTLRKTLSNYVLPDLKGKSDG